MPKSGVNRLGTARKQAKAEKHPKALSVEPCEAGTRRAIKRGCTQNPCKGGK